MLAISEISSRALPQSLKAKFDVPEIGREALPLSDRRTEAGLGTVVVASLWFLFYVVAAGYSLAFGN